MGDGGVYESPLLNRKIASHITTRQYMRDFERIIQHTLRYVNYDISHALFPLDMPYLHYSSLPDQIGGLGITIHQVWSVKVEMTGYKVQRNSWEGKLTYTFYDHFGLDWADVKKFGAWKVFGVGFKAWYILQHYRKAKPFVTRAVVAKQLCKPIYRGENPWIF